jgi:hypothetical protein
MMQDKIIDSSCCDFPQIFKRILRPRRAGGSPTVSFLAFPASSGDKSVSILITSVKMGLAVRFQTSLAKKSTFAESVFFFGINTLTRRSLAAAVTNERPPYCGEHFPYHLPPDRVGNVVARVQNPVRIGNGQGLWCQGLYEECCHWIPLRICSYDFRIPSRRNWWICNHV